jgi:hypothetical protein
MRFRLIDQEVGNQDSIARETASLLFDTTIRLFTQRLPSAAMPAAMNRSAIEPKGRQTAARTSTNKARTVKSWITAGVSGY